MTVDLTEIISGWQFLKVEHSYTLQEQKAQQYQLHIHIASFQMYHQLGKKNAFDLYIVFSTLPSSSPFSTTHILPWYQSYSEALCSSHNYAAVTFNIQLYSFIRKQGNINICFFILIIQRSDRTIALRSNFNFAFGSQYIV